MTEEADQVREELRRVLAEKREEKELRAAVFGTDGLLTKLVKGASASSPDTPIFIDLIFRRLADLRFDEFKDRDFADWRRLRNAIEHENTLTNHRMTWFFVSQGFLLAAYSSIFTNWATPDASTHTSEPVRAVQQLYPFLLVVVALLGGTMCAVTLRSLTLASEQIQRLDNWWHVGKRWADVVRSFKEGEEDRKSARLRLSPDHPPLQGSLRELVDTFVSTSNIPLYFMAVWVVLLSLTGYVYKAEVIGALSARWPYITIAVLLALLVVQSWLRREAQKTQRPAGP
jgi:hypothetical protein